MSTRFFYGSLLFLAATSPVAAQRNTFVLRSGNDTVAVEQFARTPQGLEAEALVKPMGLRFELSTVVSPDGSVRTLTSRAWSATDAPGTPARQVAVFTFRGDSVVADLATGEQKQQQRFVSRTGAIPVVNPTFSLFELLLERFRRAATDSADYPGFLISGGQTLTITARRQGADSVILSMTGGDMRLRVDPQGRILGGVIPAQRLTIDRVQAQASLLTVEKPDYSAPAGAPYTAEDLVIPTPMGHTLAGTLTLPKGASARARVPAVITITGSGSQDRDEAIPMFKGYRLFREIADTLGRRGIAVLRMDDRGHGGSGGNAAVSTSADFAKDIQAGLAYLRTRPEIDASKLALVGHSEGGLIAPKVAAVEPDLAGIVLLAGTGYAGRPILTFQVSNSIKNDTSLTPARRDSALAGVSTMIDSLAATSPWMRYFLEYDPSTTARKVKTPVLILNGATDLQVTVDHVPLLEKAFKEAGNQDVTAKILPNLNHLFVYDPDGFPGRYVQLPSFAVDKETLGLVADWLSKRLIKPAS
ncbi:MAG: alpha/beta hydrolase family protein [Gemmatimonadales bacterium]